MRPQLAVEIGPQWVTVTSGTPDALAWLGSFLRFSVKTYQGGRPSTLSLPLLHALERRYLGGLQLLVEAGARERGVDLVVRDVRVPPVRIESGNPVGWLRPEQRDALDSGLRNARGTLKLGTGAGKGEIVAGFPMMARCPWLILVHRIHLLDDLAARFEARSGEQAGRIGDGVWTQRRVTFATYATLHAALQANDPRAAMLFDCVRGIVCDEAHTVAAETFSAVLDRCSRAYWRIGVSATPFARSDRKSIMVIAHLGPMLFELDAGDLIEMGRLAKPTIRMVSLHHEPTLSGLSWSDVYKLGVVLNDTRNALVVRAVRRLPKPAIVFVQEVEHGRLLLTLLAVAGLRTTIPADDTRPAFTGFALGALDLRDRQRVIAALNTGAVDVVVATSIFNEGVDVRGLRTVVNAAGGQSSISTLQRVGRATRRTDGKETCEVVDFMDLGVPSLERHARARRRAYLKEGFEVSVQDTPSFDPVHTPSTHAPELPFSPPRT
jgi:superfamily II DNA or RNA helicase